MPAPSTLLAFFGFAIGMVLTPGPNMIYLVSRSICQGPVAGLVSLAGVALAFVVYMLAAVLGITALLFAVPHAYDALRLAGACYLATLAWITLRPGGRSPFQVHDLPSDPPAKLFSMGFLTSLLNPKVAMLYLSLLPQFIDPALGNVLGQSLLLGAIQIATSITINSAIVFSAAGIATFLAARPTWLLVQRWIMGSVLGALALRMATESRR
jgi:threonine/homoserine/homoserine lactone efflux protein